MSVLIGANDLSGFTGSAYTTALFSYYDSLRTAGWKVLACTVLPLGGGATAHNTARAIVNVPI
jgi:hypothetical protein